MSPKARRQLTIGLLIVSCASLIFFLVNISQQKNHTIQPTHLPQTLIERLKTFIPEDSITFDQSDPQQLVVLWKDLNIKIGSPQENLNQKIIVLKALFPIIQNRYDYIEYVDIRYPDNAVIKYMPVSRTTQNATLSRI